MFIKEFTKKKFFIATIDKDTKKWTISRDIKTFHLA